MKPQPLELLSPAANFETAKQAILHGADAVYIGPPSHGARKSAANSLDDIAELVDFAHQYRSKVYATVNTIVYDNEIKKVETLCQDLYNIGVDALIIQDMGILRMNLPPIALHASTQCDIRTPEKAKFLEEVGFSQIVLARELTLDEIKAITETVKIPVETFIHGALCVSYSGRCHASLAITDRSANRGECAQICRLPFSLEDEEGRMLINNKYLLSLKDYNASPKLEDLINAGVSSFKIEGRLKDIGYVKNITALYNIQLNNIILNNPRKYYRSSFGEVSIKFDPKADKSFNRGFTTYFLENRRQQSIASIETPKSRGELINDLNALNNGDGISFYDKEGNFTGVNVNKIENGKIIPARKVIIPKGSPVYRTLDIKWDKTLSAETAIRKIPVDISISDVDIKAQDARGVEVSLPLNLDYERAKSPRDYKDIFSKLGNTPYILRNYNSTLNPDRFYRISELSELRRKLIEDLNKANFESYHSDKRREENKNAISPNRNLDYKDNVANKLAEEFYKSHGVKVIEKAKEVTRQFEKGDVLMTTRHCILRELGMCLKEKRQSDEFRLPLYLHYDTGKFKLDFDCKKCEMKLLKN